MRKLQFIVPERCAGMQVQTYLRREQGFSSNVLRQLKRTPGGLTRNGGHVRTIDLLHSGDRLGLLLLDAPAEAVRSNRHVDILFEDDDIIVYNKPPGIIVHQAKHHQEETLANVFAAHCAKSGVQRIFRAMGRLDTDTSGALLVAKHSYAATRLNANIDKTYIALCCGTVPFSAGVVEAPIGRLADDYINRIVTESGQYARTHFKVVGRGEKKDYTLAQFELPTGRTHQIRVHMSWIGHPVAGDDLYGVDRSIIARQALHCAQLRFEHPVRGEPMVIDAPLPEDIRAALSSAGVR